MSESKSTILTAAMTHGLILGLFWAAKYVLFMVGYNSMLLNSIYIMLTPITLVIAYAATRRFRMDSEEELSFFKAWQFGILLYFFAALIVSLPHYIFYEYIAPPGYLAEAMSSVLELVRDSNVPADILETMETMAVPSPIKMTIQQIFNNVFYGVLFSVPVAFMATRYSRDLPDNEDTRKNVS